MTSIAGAVFAYLARSTPRVTRFFVLPPEKATFAINAQRAAGGVISPDGRTLAFTARDATGKILLWVRALDSLVAQPLAGTDGAASPFWSPDSRFLAYFTPGRLMKVAATGGPPQTLSANSGNRGGAWNADGDIVMNGGAGQPLMRVSSAGGQTAPVVETVGGYSPVYPSFLPGGRQVLFWANAGERTGVYVGSLDTRKSTFLLGADSGGIYDARTGLLLFVRQGTLLAQPFDHRTSTLSGEPVPVAERVESSVIPAVVAFSLSNDGALAYGTGTGNTVGLQIVVVDRSGKTIGTVAPQDNYRGLELSPDGTRLAAHRHAGEGGDIWITEMTRGTTTRFTFDATQDNFAPVWSPDGAHIAFSSLRAGKWGIYRKPSNGAGNEERLAEESTVAIMVPLSWSRDGASIVYQSVGTKSTWDLYMLPLTGDRPSASSGRPEPVEGRKPMTLLQTAFHETLAQVSPDGKWLAYQSNESGRNEVYVQPFPSGAGKWQVSVEGAFVPRWRRDGRELFYMDLASRRMTAVPILPRGDTFQAGTPQGLFEHGLLNAAHPGNYFTYEVSADGQRFFIPRTASNVTEQAVASPIAVVLNWDAKR
jgi:Tol biopolymer transport system component